MSKKQVFWLTFWIVAILIVIPKGMLIPECQSSVTETPYIVVITATTTELDAFTNSVERLLTCQIGMQQYALVVYEESQFLITIIGVGPSRAMEAVTNIVENLNPIAIVFSGTAGVLDDTLQLEIGQTVVATTWHYDSWAKQSVQVSNRMVEIANTMDYDLIFVDNGVTTDHFIKNMFEKDTLYLDYNAAIVDMESYVIAEVAVEKKIPFIAFRSISDYADGVQKPEFRALASYNSANATLLFITQLLQVSH